MLHGAAMIKILQLGLRLEAGALLSLMLHLLLQQQPTTNADLLKKYGV